MNTPPTNPIPLASEAPIPVTGNSAPQRASFARDEILNVLKHYPVGNVESVRELIAGSAEAPKALIECELGKLLLKRRARGLEHASQVGFAHEVINRCLVSGVCVPPLIGTNGQNNSMCQIGDQTYELFVFIEGTMFDQSPTHAQESGKLLGELHGSLDDYVPSFEATIESEVVNPNRIASMELPHEMLLKVKRILEYGLDAHRANARTSGIVHGDWHPGNMIFSGTEIVSICDFDNCRVGSRDRELAQALVYLSMKRAEGDQIPREPDVNRMASAWKGYCEAAPSKPDSRLVSALMPAVLLDEALAGTANDSPQHGSKRAALLDIALQKAVWLDEHLSEIQRALDS